MLNISYSMIDGKPPSKLPSRYMDDLPSNFQERIFQLRRPQDRCNRLSGAVLLKRAGIARGLDKDFLQEIKYTSNGRPFYNKKIDFNISHSNQCTTCVISKGITVGIDIEHYRPININDFRTQFSPKEWQYLQKAKNKNLLFYQLWTAKEAIAKADGRGLIYPFDQIAVRENAGRMEKVTYNLWRFTIEREYIGTLAFTARAPRIDMQKVSLWK